MLAEFVKAIAEQAVSASRWKVIKPSMEPDHVYLLENGDGGIDKHRAEPSPRAHRALCLDAICEFAKLNKGTASIWYSRESVTCLTNDADRRDKLTLVLRNSPQIDCLLVWEKAKPRLSHKDAINILRTTFARCLAPAGEFLGLIRNLKFVNGQIDEANLQSSKRSIGQKIEQSVTGVSAIPEYVSFDVPIFAGVFSFRQNIELAVEIDPATQTFQFVPLPKEIENSFEAAELAIYGSIMDELDGVKVPVYHGIP